ncbi:hypothetical protein EVAR_98125_1 [Eumeta japonica]|uniref:Uncharacterized protein n=1 Tax=Eumeta variegata TaxID=151549 RepID=A0A4C2AAK8_EUMVA|nr:hypothetical protein EVAR_98125_1 [Eumeta japonica]
MEGHNELWSPRLLDDGGAEGHQLTRAALLLIWKRRPGDFITAGGTELLTRNFAEDLHESPPHCTEYGSLLSLLSKTLFTVEQQQPPSNPLNLHILRENPSPDSVDFFHEYEQRAADVTRRKAESRSESRRGTEQGVSGGNRISDEDETKIEAGSGTGIEVQSITGIGALIKTGIARYDGEHSAVSAEYRHCIGDYFKPYQREGLKGPSYLIGNNTEKSRIYQYNREKLERILVSYGKCATMKTP